jgi:hypothetical protein
MKHTKKLLKGTFEKSKEGLSYLKALYDQQSAPVLFVKGDASDNFAQWMSALFPDSQLLDRKEFEKQQENLRGKLVIVTGVNRLKDDTVDAAMACRKRGINVIVSLSQHPKILDYVSDPAFKIIEVNELSTVEMQEEIEKVRKKIT